MKKLFFFVNALLVMSAMSVSARVYVQTANPNDPRWTVTLGEKDQLITFTSVADLPVTGQKELWFAAGTYVFDATFGLTQIDAVLAGGFKGTETSLEEREMIEDGEAWDFANATILDGAGTVKLIADSKRTCFDGLTMQGSVNNNASVNNGNAGVVRLSSDETHTPYVRNCRFLNNSAKQGGVLQLYQASAVIENCYFEGNSGTQGGAVYCSSTSGALTISNCYFKNNTASIANNNAGGAVHAQNAVLLTVSGCVFEGNSETGSSQGAALSNNTSNPGTLVYNNVFVDNVASDVEEARKCCVLMATGSFYHNTVVESTGTALWQKAGNMKNNVFYGASVEKARVSLDKGVVATNNAGVNAWGADADATNIVISTNNKPLEGDAEGTLYAYFADPETHDFALQAGSALIKAGVAIDGITTDIDEEDRKNADIGAYAYMSAETAVENTAKPAVDIHAALQMGEVYNILGQRVSEIQAGNIYIVSGQKILVR